MVGVLYLLTPRVSPLHHRRWRGLGVRPSLRTRRVVLIATPVLRLVRTAVRLIPNGELPPLSVEGCDNGLVSVFSAKAAVFYMDRGPEHSVKMAQKHATRFGVSIEFRAIGEHPSPGVAADWMRAGREGR